MGDRLVGNIGPYKPLKNYLASAKENKQQETEAESDDFFVYQGKDHLIHCVDGNENNFLKIFKYKGEYYDVHYDNNAKKAFIIFCRIKNKNYNVHYDRKEKKHYILITKSYFVESNINAEDIHLINFYEFEGKEYEVKYDELGKPFIEASLKKKHNMLEKVMEVFAGNKFYIPENEIKNIYKRNVYKDEDGKEQTVYHRNNQPYIITTTLDSFDPYPLDKKTPIYKHILNENEIKKIEIIKI